MDDIVIRVLIAVVVGVVIGILFLVKAVVHGSMIEKKIVNSIKSGDKAFYQNNFSEAYKFYRLALTYLLGIKGKEPLTAVGIGESMDDHGWTLIEKIGKIYAKKNISHSWQELEDVIADIDSLAKNEEYTNEYGGATKTGEPIFDAMIHKLTGIYDKMPNV